MTGLRPAARTVASTSAACAQSALMIASCPCGSKSRTGAFLRRDIPQPWDDNRDGHGPDLVKPAAWRRTPSSRFWSRPCDDASIATCCRPSSASVCSVSCSVTDQGSSGIHTLSHRRATHQACRCWRTDGRRAETIAAQNRRLMFSTGAGNRDNGGRLPGIKRGSGLCQRQPCIADRDDWRSSVGTRWRLRDNGRCTTRHGVSHKLRAVRLDAGNSHKKKSRLHAAGIRRDAGDGDGSSRPLTDGRISPSSLRRPPAQPRHDGKWIGGNLKPRLNAHDRRNTLDNPPCHRCSIPACGGITMRFGKALRFVKQCHEQVTRMIRRCDRHEGREQFALGVAAIDDLFCRAGFCTNIIAGTLARVAEPFSTFSRIMKRMASDVSGLRTRTATCRASSGVRFRNVGVIR